MPEHARRLLPAVLLAAAAALLLGLGVDERPLQNFDEGIHAAVSLETLQRGEWWMPQLAGEPYFRKPPLKLWASSGLMAVVGPSLWAVRLPSLLAGWLCALLLALWVSEAGGSRLQAAVTGLAFASMRPSFYHLFRSGETDGMLTLFVTASLYCWWKLRRGRSAHRWAALLGACLGLGFMTKATPALLPLPVLALDAALARRAPPAAAVGIALAVFVLVAAPWHIAVSIAQGQAFWDHYLGVEVFERVLRPLHTEGRGVLFYLGLLPAFLFPLSALLLPGLLHAARRERLWPIWFACGFLAITVMQSRASWYLAPILPAAVVMAVAFLVRARPLAGDRLADLGWILAVFAGLAFLPPLLLDQRGPEPLLLAAAGTAIAVALLRWQRHRIPPLLLSRLAIGGVLVAQLAVWAVEVRRIPEPNPLAALAADLGTAGEPVRLASLVALHWAEPAGYFHLLAQPAVEVELVEDWHAAVAGPGPGARRILAAADAEAPAELASDWIRGKRYGDYALFEPR